MKFRHVQQLGIAHVSMQTSGFLYVMCLYLASCHLCGSGAGRHHRQESRSGTDIKHVRDPPTRFHRLHSVLQTYVVLLILEDSHAQITQEFDLKNAPFLCRAAYHHTATYIRNIYYAYSSSGWAREYLASSGERSQSSSSMSLSCTIHSALPVVGLQRLTNILTSRINTWVGGASVRWRLKKKKRSWMAWLRRTVTSCRRLGLAPYQVRLVRIIAGRRENHHLLYLTNSPLHLLRPRMRQRKVKERSQASSPRSSSRHIWKCEMCPVRTES